MNLFKKLSHKKDERMVNIELLRLAKMPYLNLFMNHLLIIRNVFLMYLMEHL